MLAETSASDSLLNQLGEKRLIFTLTTGRSGTCYLAELLRHLPGVASYHEPEPKFSHLMRAVQTDPLIAERFWSSSKLPAIARVSEPIYVETTHLFGKGFIEPLLSWGILPDLILLRRAPRLVAKSLFELGTIPGRSPDGLKFCLSPDDPGVLSIPGWQDLHAYQLCYWYCLETERRLEVYKRIFLGKSARVVEIALDELGSLEGLQKLITELQLPVPDEATWKRLEGARQRPLNQKERFKVEDPELTEDRMAALEVEVDAMIEHEDPSIVPGAPGTPVQANTVATNHASQPILSTVILNWNRSDLLQRTLESYRETVHLPYELFIVDNASTDDSRRVIEEFCAATPQAKAIFATENLGGEAFNLGLAQCRGAFVHLSENDIEYLPGWLEKVLEVFEAFPNIGQLSVFGPVPEDGEVWEIKPSVLRHARGKIVYETLANVGTTSLLRGELLARGLRIHNIPSTGTFLFPDDPGLSRFVKEAGYMVAWADRYLVRNLGHQWEEFTTRRSYYQENYHSKPWLGEAGWDQRKTQWQEKARPARRSALFPLEPVSAEKSDPSPACPEPYLWSMIDGWTAEVETLEFLHALVRLVKPRFVLETGTWHGYAAAAMGKALQANGRGSLVTLELDPESARVANEQINHAQLDGVVRVLNQSSLDYHPEQTIDLLLLDSALEVRESEFARFSPWLAPGALVVFHDTSDRHDLVVQGVRRLMAAGKLKGFLLSTPRGIAVCQSVRDDPALASEKAAALTTAVVSGNGAGEDREGVEQPVAAEGGGISRTAVIENGCQVQQSDTEGIPDQTPLLVDNPIPLAIMGMHRSGTSMITRLLNLSGMYLGEEGELIEAQADNPEGYWENSGFLRLNEALLGHLGGAWDLPPQLPAGWEQDAKLEDLRSQAGDLFERFQAQPFWGWKDPRTSLTLPFWKCLLPELRALIVVRNPLAVARSLFRRGWNSPRFSYHLWHAYNQNLLAATSESQRLVTHYDAYFLDPQSELERVLDWLGVTVAPETVARAVTAISTDLHHNRVTREEMLAESLPEDVLELYDWLCQQAGPVYQSSFVMQAGAVNVNAGDHAGKKPAGREELPSSDESGQSASKVASLPVTDQVHPEVHDDQEGSRQVELVLEAAEHVPSPPAHGKGYAKKNGRQPRSGRRTTGMTYALYTSSQGNYFFDEIRDLIAAGLKGAGRRVKITGERQGFVKDADWHIVIAPHEFFYLGSGNDLRRRELPNNLVLFNTEQPSTKWFALAFGLFSRARHIWDISAASAEALTRHGYPAQFLPLGYAPDFPPFGAGKRLPLNYGTCTLDTEVRRRTDGNTPLKERPLDLVFVGSNTPRRSYFFARNAPVFSKYRTYLHLPSNTRPIIPGSTTHMNTETVVGLAQRAKLFLNIHHGVDQFFEWHRIVMLGIWQKTLVVSEPCSPSPPFKAGVDYVEASQDEIPERVEYYLDDPRGRQEAQSIAEHGYRTLTQECRIAKNLSPLLSQLEDLREEARHERR